MLVSLTLSVVLFFGAAMYGMDPLLQYGPESNLFSYYTYTEIYSNPGIAKNYDYNAVLLGSSMVENADVNEIDSLFGCTTVKLPYSGASAYNYKCILDVCYDSGHQIDKVFWSLDEYSLTTDPNTPRYPLPEYLYDFDKTNDLSYVLNMDIVYFYTIKNAIGTLTNQTEPLMKNGAWISEENYNKANALASISYPMDAQEDRGKDYVAQDLSDNLQQNILPYIQNHPETEFYIFFPPYSISYWYMSKQDGKLAAEYHILETLVEELLEYENVNLYFFQDQEEIITNLENYKDYSHFSPSINCYMSNQIAQDQNRLTEENYRERLDAFYQYLLNFDYDGFYQAQME
jgi:hypothetical protein